MENDFEAVVYSENVIGFAALASEYCNLLDQTAMLSQKDFIDKAHRMLPLLYLKAIVLPDVEPIMPELIEKTVTHEEWEAVQLTVLPKMGNYDSYQEMYDALNDGAQMSSLSEGFTDVYQDLKDFLSAYNMGTPEIMSDAIWDCKNNFKNFWGQRITNIQRVMHYLLYSVELNQDDALTEEDFDLDKRAPRTFEGMAHDEEDYE